MKNIKDKIFYYILLLDHYPLLVYLMVMTIYLFCFIYFTDVIYCDDGANLEQLKSQLVIENEKYKHSLSVFRVAEKRYNEVVKTISRSDPFINRNDPFYKSLINDIHLTFSICNNIYNNMQGLEIIILGIDPNFIPMHRESFHCYIE